jgi:hypothetical protein
MALALTQLTSGNSTSATASTASVTIPNDSVCYVTVMLNGNSPSDTLSTTISSASLSWSQVYSQVLSVGSSRGRTIACWRAINTTGSDVTEAISTNSTAGSGLFEEIAWSVVRATGIDTTTPNGTAQSGTWTSGTITLGSVGTPDAGDIVFGGHQSSTSSNSASNFDGFTNISDIATTNGRNLKVSYDASDPQDDTPAIISGSGAVGAFLINVAGAAPSFRAWDYAPDVQQILHNPR